MRRGFGLVAFALGILIIGAAVVVAVTTENFRAARGATLGILFVAFGIAWMRGQSYGK